MEAETRQKLQDLQILEQNLQNLLVQKQTIQEDLSEVLNALEEVKRTSDAVYKMVGSIMVVVDKKKTIEELEEKRKLAELRNASVVKQEKLIETKAHELQEELKNLLQKSPSTAK